MLTQTEAGPHTIPANPVPPQDDLGLDRAFLMQMARIPFIAAGWVLVAFLSHQVWDAIAPNSTNYAPLVVLCFGMVLAAVIDGWAFKVPNWLTLSLVLSGWVLGAFHSLGVSIDAGVGGLGAALLCTAIGFGSTSFESSAIMASIAASGESATELSGWLSFDPSR